VLAVQRSLSKRSDPSTGQGYVKIDAIQPPQAASLFIRSHFNAAIAKQLAAGKMTGAVAARFRADVANVPDSFFTKLRVASEFGTYAGGPDGPGKELVPPIGVPDFLVCENAGAALSCQDLNGDQHVPLGAGSTWHKEPQTRVQRHHVNATSGSRRASASQRRSTGSSSTSRSQPHPQPQLQRAARRG
jgi:hypothetical protein